MLPRSESTQLNISTAGAQIIAPAVLPDAPVAPRKFLVIFMALLSSLLLSTLAALVLAVRKRDRAIHSIRDVSTNLGVPLLGSVPPIQATDLTFNQATPALRDDSNAMVAITSGIARDCPGKAPRIIYVTSTTDGEGKSTVAANLANSFAGKERVLLVDADIRKTVPTELPVAPGYQGLTELLADRARLKDVIKHRGQEGVDLMSAGLGSADPLPLLSSGRVDSMFKVLSLSYDRIIVDGPAVGECDDSLQLARHANSVVFVTRCDDTAVMQVRSSLERLRHGGIRITGLVLNHMDRRNVIIDSGTDPEAGKFSNATSIPDKRNLSQVMQLNSKKSSFVDLT